MALDADWVFLSACNTAAADGTPAAEGLSGLARAFFYAGARALLVSHWTVGTNAAEQLTTGLQAALHDHPDWGRAEALRYAMNDLLTAPAADYQAFPGCWLLGALYCDRRKWRIKSCGPAGLPGPHLTAAGPRPRPGDRPRCHLA